MGEIKHIGVMISVGRHGGGTYQWSVNILHALKEYAQIKKNIQIHLFYQSKLFDPKSILSSFPTFQLHEIKKDSFSKYLRFLFLKIPAFIPIIKFFYPLNRTQQIRKLHLMIFAGFSFEVPFYSGKHLFMFTDIAHVFYPHFKEFKDKNEILVRNLILKYGIKYAARTVVESQQLKKDIEQHYNAKASKVDILYQVLPKELDLLIQTKETVSVDFKNRIPADYLFYPAQLWEHKNHINLLKALQIVIKQYPTIKLVLTGTRTKDDEYIFDFIHQTGLKEQVIYLGYVSDAELIHCYKNAKALVMPTYFGPTNIPTLEAFYFGIPAVISDLPGVQEQTQDAVFLFNPDSAEEVAEKIIDVLSNPAIREEKIKKGVARLQELSFENYSKTMFSILDKTLQK